MTDTTRLDMSLRLIKMDGLVAPVVRALGSGTKSGSKSRPSTSKSRLLEADSDDRRRERLPASRHLRNSRVASSSPEQASPVLKKSMRKHAPRIRFFRTENLGLRVDMVTGVTRDMLLLTVKLSQVVVTVISSRRRTLEQLGRSR